jgi:hypothetical protein
MFTLLLGYPGNPPASRLPATRVTTSAYINPALNVITVGQGKDLKGIKEI